MNNVLLTLAQVAAGGSSSGGGATVLDFSDEEVKWDEEVMANVVGEDFDAGPLYAALQAGSPVWIDISGSDCIERQLVVKWVYNTESGLLFMTTPDFCYEFTNVSTGGDTGNDDDSGSDGGSLDRPWTPPLGPLIMKIPVANA